MSEFLYVQEQLVEQIKALGEAGKFQTFDGALPTGKQLKQTNGRYWPYVVYGLGGKSEAANRMRGIGSSRDDIKWTSLVFFCVADTPTTIRRLKDVLRTEFEGYEPVVGWGQFTEVLSGDFGISKPDPDLTPLRFGETIAFSAMTDV